jgi:hypothetical protein
MWSRCRLLNSLSELHSIHLLSLDSVVKLLWCSGGETCLVSHLNFFAVICSSLEEVSLLLLCICGEPTVVTGQNSGRNQIFD